MSEGLCGTSMFGGDRWGVGVNPMTAGKYIYEILKKYLTVLGRYTNILIHFLNFLFFNFLFYINMS